MEGGVHCILLGLLFVWGAIALGFMSSTQIQQALNALALLNGELPGSPSGTETVSDAAKAMIAGGKHAQTTLTAAIALGWWCAANLFLDFFLVLIKVGRSMRRGRWALPITELDMPDPMDKTMRGLAAAGDSRSTLVAVANGCV